MRFNSAASARVRVAMLIGALLALALVPTVANAAPKKPFFRFSATSYSVAESAGSFDVAVVRTGNTRIPASVDYSVANGGTTAVAGINYTLTAGTLSFAAGETRKAFTVTILHDPNFTPNRKIVFKLANPQPTGSLIKGTGSATLTILDVDGPGTIDFSNTSYSVVESAGVATVSVSRDSAPNLVESVDYATSDGTAVAGTDYATTTGTLTFQTGEMTKSFQVPVTDDQLFNGNRTFNVTLSNPQNLSNPLLGAPAIGPNSPAPVTIQDDDIPTFSFSSPTYSVNEPSSGMTTFDVTLTRGGATYVPADVVVSDLGTGSAVAPTSYSAFAPQTVHFDAGQTSKPFTVTIKNDGATSGNQTIDLGLALNGKQVDKTELSIVDYDSTVPSVQFAAPTYTVNEAQTSVTVTVSLAGPATSSDVTVPYATADGTATAGPPPNTDGSADYQATSGNLTIPAGQRSGSITVPLNPDTVAEGDETFTVALGPGATGAILGDPKTTTVTIVDDDGVGTLAFSAQRYDVNEKDGQVTITVNRIGGTSGPAAVDYATVDGTAHAPGDYRATSGTLNFADGETQKTFTVPVAWDGRAEGDQTVTLTLSNFVSDDDAGTVKAAVLHIADDGASGPVQFSAPSYNVLENAGAATITVSRSGGSLGGPVTVDYATSDGTAHAGKDYTATHGTLTFGPGEASKTFQVPVHNDTIHQGSRSLTLSLSHPGGGTSLGGQSTAKLNIGDDDPISSPSKARPTLKLTARRLQRLSSKRLVFTVRSSSSVKLGVGANVRKGKRLVKVAGASRRIAANRNVTITLKLSRKALSKLRSALVKGKERVTFTVTGTDALGNRATVRLTITLR